MRFCRFIFTVGLAATSNILGPVAWADHPVELERIDVTAERDRALTVPAAATARKDIEKRQAA